jgi:hypothetical protein
MFHKLVRSYVAAAAAGALVLGCKADELLEPAPSHAPPAASVELTTASTTLSWSVRRQLPAAVRAATAAVSGTRIFLFGGNLGSASPTAATRIYTLSTNTWTSGAKFQRPRDFAMAAGMADGVHLVGGTGTGGIMTDHRVYRPSTNTWVARAPLPTAVNAAVAQVVGGKLYIIGGGSGSGPTGKVQVYNPSTSSWVIKRSMPTARLSAASAVINGLIYVAGGQTAGIGTTAVLERYDPATNTWTALRAMPVRREALSGGNVNGEFCVAGGRLAAATPTGNASGQTYCYNRGTNAWVRGPDMITPRVETASALLNGALYTLGGRTSSTLTSRVATRLQALPTPGSVRVLTVTTGPDQDANGYDLALDGGTTQHIGITAEVTLGNLAPGSHTLVLSGVAPNCAIDGGPSRTVLVTAGGQTEASFAVTCTTGRSLDLVSARDQIPGSFTTPRAVYADRNRIYLGSFQGTLFVLARDLAAGFPVVQRIELGIQITGVGGDNDRLYITSPDGLRVYAKGSSLTQIGSLVLPGYYVTLELFENYLYLSRGQAQLAVDRERLYLAQLNDGDVAWEVDKATLQVTRVYGTTFLEHQTGVYDRLTGSLVVTIPNPLDTRGVRSMPRPYSNGVDLYQTVGGCCGQGITIVKGPDFVRSEFIGATFTNVVTSVPNGLVGGLETGSVEYFDLNNQLIKQVDLPLLTGHTRPEDIEIRSLWADGLDDLVFAGSSWGNDVSRGPTLPSFFVLRLR